MVVALSVAKINSPSDSRHTKIFDIQELRQKVSERYDHV